MRFGNFIHREEFDSLAKKDSSEGQFYVLPRKEADAWNSACDQEVDNGCTLSPKIY